MGSYPKDSFQYSGEDRVTDHEIINAGGYAADPVQFRDIGNGHCSQGDAVFIIIMLKEFCLIPGHIHIRRAFRFAAFAGKAQVHDIVNLPMGERIPFIRTGEEFPEDIGPGAGGRVLVAGGHVARAHGTAYEVGLAAVAGAVATFRRPQDPAIF